MASQISSTVWLLVQKHVKADIKENIGDLDHRNLPLKR